MIDPGFEILNQRGTPMFFSDVFANRPTAGVVGRMFISTDTYAFYRDTGTTWDLIGGPGTGTISGTIGTGQVAFGSSANTISGTNNFFWDNANTKLGIGTNLPTDQLTLTGNLKVNQIRFDGRSIYNILIGDSNWTNLTGLYNTFIGTAAGNSNTSGYANTFLGVFTGGNNTTGIANTFLGYQAGFEHTTATGNTLIGVDAGYRQKDQNFTTIIGYHAGQYVNKEKTLIIGADAASDTLYSGDQNTIIGYAAGYQNRTGGYNTFLGNKGGYGIRNGNNNVMIGFETGNTLSDASNNTFLGYRSGYNNTTGSELTFVGTSSGFSNTTATFNTFIGYETGRFTNTGGNNTAIGYRSMYSNTTGSDLTFIGTLAGFANTTATQNTFIGVDAGRFTNTGSTNTAIGYRSQYSATTAYNMISIGALSSFSLTTGSQNVHIGYSGGRSITTGQFNVFIGENAGFNASQKVDASNSIAIGYATFTNANNQVILGNSSITQTIIRPKVLIGHTTAFTANEDLQLTGTQQNKDARTYSTGAIQSFRVQKDLTIAGGATISSASTLSNFVSTGDSNFGGNITIPDSSPFANIYAANSYRFSAGTATITVTQASGSTRSISQIWAQNYFTGTLSGTITHLSSIVTPGFYNSNSGTITPVITNAYQLLINDIGEYGHTFTITNRWGIYQEGANDDNYFKGRILANSTTDTGEQIQITGSIRINNQLSGTAGGSSGQHLIVNCDGTTYKIALLNN